MNFFLFLIASLSTLVVVDGRLGRRLQDPAAYEDCVDECEKNSWANPAKACQDAESGFGRDYAECIQNLLSWQNDKKMVKGVCERTCDL
mmetsp:Transcript_28802/g.43502  ORF Transcript_28802/g.43502 Transcript_28802/m.43502 type:complete len:89 (-) Transcript_28802:128-394(-)